MKKEEKCTGITLINVEDSLKFEGCPVCRSIRRSEEETIKTILYEGVNDPAIRKKFRESLGLCPYHAWLFTEVASRPDVLDGLGSTIIYEDMLSEAVSYLKIDSLNSKLRKLKECPLCTLAREVEANLVDDIVECFESRPEILLAYEESSSIFCLRHYLMIYEKLSKEEIRDELKRIQLEKMRRILHLLREYIRKSDYRVKERIRPEEAAAWIRAVEVLKGYPNSRVYANSTLKSVKRSKKLL